MLKPKVFASAKFTRDMAEALVAHFEDYAQDGIVSIEVTDHGLWWENPDGSRQFLGAIEKFPSSKRKKMN